MNAEKMKREKNQLVTEMRAILDTVESRSDKAMTAEEEAKYSEMETKVDALSKTISRAEKLAAEEVVTAKAVSNQESTEFRKFGDYLEEVFARGNERRATTMGNPNTAGLLVPAEFVSTLREVPAELTVVRNYATMIPASEASPDAPTSVPVLDQFGDNGVYGGVTMRWTAETGARQKAGEFAVKQVTYTPHNVNGFIEVSNQMLDNYEAIAKYAQQLMSKAIANMEETAFLAGSGIGQPVGLVGSPCNAIAPRTTAGAVSYEDIVNMLTLTINGGSYVFLASRSTMSTLLKMKDGGGNLVWQASARDGVPGTLFGYPVYFSDRLPALGTSGDIVLADLSSYGIKDGTPLSMFTDPYTQAADGITRLFVSWRVDGKPLLLTPVKGNDSVSRSSFVTLQ